MAASRDDSHPGGRVASKSFIVRLRKMFPWTNRERVCGRASSLKMLVVAAPDLPLQLVLVVSIVAEDISDDDHGQDDDEASRRADDDDIIAGGDSMNDARTEAEDWTRMVSSARTKSGERPNWAGGGSDFILPLVWGMLSST